MEASCPPRAMPRSRAAAAMSSRYWGPVRQYNIVGPASFCLWPFTSHWGLIP